VGPRLPDVQGVAHSDYEKGNEGHKARAEGDKWLSRRDDRGTGRTGIESELCTMV